MMEHTVPGPEMTLNLVSPQGVLYTGRFDSLQIPAYDGLRGILRGHAPFVGKLGIGVMKIDGAGESSRFGIYGGFYQVSPGRVDVVVDKVDVPSSLDPESCRAEYEALTTPGRRDYDRFEEYQTKRKIAGIRLRLVERNRKP